MKLAIAITSGLLMLAGPSLAWASCDAKQSDQIPTARYAFTGDEVYDTKTNLTWQRCSYGQHWKEGTGCVGFIQMETEDQMLRWSRPQPAGAWRIPTTDELKTLVSEACTMPSINDEAFPNMNVRKLRYWTNNSSGGSDTVAWYVDFRFGRSEFKDRPEIAAVRLVRDER